MKLARILPLGAVAFVAVVALVDCSSASSNASAPAGDGGASETSAADAPANEGASLADSGENAGPTQDESEPNGGDLGPDDKPQTNAMTIPGTMRGAIDPKDDADIFAIEPKPGEVWRWSLEARDGASYVPHLTVFDIAPNNLNPTQLAKADSKSVRIELDHFVVRPGSFVATVRDARNVPASSSAHVGGSDVTYALAARKVTVTPTKVDIPQTVTGSLPSVSSVALYSFTATKNQKIEIIVRAARKAQPSELDSRMTLFNATTKTAVLTNDNAGGATKDSEIRGPMPSDGEYWIVLENEADMIYDPSAVPDLSYEIEFALMP